jgi:hypothetical protein
MLTHKFFSCYYYCNDNKSLAYHKTFRIPITSIPESLRPIEKHNIDLIEETEIIFEEDTIKIAINGAVGTLTDTLTEQKGKPVTIFKCIVLSHKI